MKKFIVLVVLCFGFNTMVLADRADDLRQSCDLGNGSSCQHLGVVYKLKKDHLQASKFYKKAAKAHKTACYSGSVSGCMSLALIYEYGTGVKDKFKVIESYKKACELGDDRGCHVLGVMYERGKGTREDKKEAIKYYGKACNLKSQSGCKNYVRLNKITEK
ncbi:TETRATRICOPEPTIDE REPEAT FAMILY PROTEIN [uncultured Candidatus Thioglobus sp.]|nr:TETRATRICOPEPTIDE REPEAT FAMILY PROTEIN [uncultured Candidatus Thioglobus sp.]